MDCATGLAGSDGVAIEINGDTPTGFPIDASREDFKDLVKRKRGESFHRLGGGAGIAAALSSSPESGIGGDDGDILRRQEAFGRNEYPKSKPNSLFKLMGHAFWDAGVIVLLVRAIVSIGYGIMNHGIQDGCYGAIPVLIAALLVAVVSAASTYSQAKRSDDLLPSTFSVQVIRRGQRQETSICDLVVGDVVPLKIGDVVPADGVLLHGHGLHVDDSNMTGNRRPVQIDANDTPFLTSGAKVADGYGTMLVTAVGTATAMGEMMSSTTRGKADTTPIQERLQDVKSIIGRIGSPLMDRQHVTIVALLSAIVGILLQAVAIPQGLLLGLTLMLSFTMKRMAEDHVLVRRVSACQTMASVTDICILKLMKEPCRPEVRTAVEACTKAGVQVKMVTGDDILRARAIAMGSGIISNSDHDAIVIEGQEFRAVSPEEQLEIVDRIRVMARSLPMDKLVLVQRLKQRGHVVAVTGDGTNDAPALKEADVGLSMGIQGTEVAKESSDIIIMNDNFDTVVTAIRWGRCVFNNIQKFIQFQLTVNVAALIINIVVVITSGKMPLTAERLLWVNLAMDTFGALALATDPPTDELMRRPPVGLMEPLISNSMWRNLLAQAAYQVAAVLGLHYRGRDIFGTSEVDNGSMIFTVFFLCQVFNLFNAREIERKNVFAGVHRNWMFLAIVAALLGVQVVMVGVLTWLSGTEMLRSGQWGTCVAIAAMSWPIGWAIKFIPVPDRPLHEILARWKCF